MYVRLLGTRRRSLTAALLLLSLLPACRAEYREPPMLPPSASPGRPDAPVRPDSSTSSAVGDTAGAVTGRLPTWNRQELIGTASGFLSTIERGDQAGLRRMLSGRSLQLLEDFGAGNDVLSLSREALGSLRDRRYTLLGGRPDSVAVLVSGRRTDDTTRDEIILALLREQGEWKVMYPGALYPRNHLRR